MKPIFHHSISVSNLEGSREFYESKLQGKVGRVTDKWIDIWLFGAQVTLYDRAAAVVPHPYIRGQHFGATVSLEAWHRIRDDLVSGNSVFELSPNINEETGTAKLMIADPDGYLIEIKAYYDAQSSLNRPTT